jgi:uncharacterized protein YlxW (UPF0749 family)
VSVLAIILIVLAVLVAILAVGGAVASARRQRAREAQLQAQIRAADQELARAHADDKGWERAAMEAAAREAALGRLGSAEITGMQLVQVVDRPGTDADEAVFRVQTADGEHTVNLGRRDGAWIAV